MRLDVGERLGVTILDRRGRVPGRTSGRRVTHPRRASSWVAPSPTEFLSALSRLWRKGATGREGAQKSWNGRSPRWTASFSLGKGHVDAITPLTRRRPIRRRTHGRWRCLPSGEWPGPRQSALARPRRSPAGDSTRPPDGTLFTLSPQCRPLALTSSSFGAPNRMASSLGLRAAAPARARVATQSSRSMVVRAAVSTPAPVVVKREGTPGAGPAINP